MGGGDSGGTLRPVTVQPDRCGQASASPLAGRPVGVKGNAGPAPGAGRQTVAH